MNIDEIAKLAGVSKSAVSRYLNDGYLSEEKRAAIKEVIDKTGYTPSAQAQSLRMKKTNLIGVVLPKISSESISRIVAGLSEVLYQNGYQLLLANTDNDSTREVEYLDTFRYNKVDGIVLIATMFSQRHKQILSEIRVPVVIVGQEYGDYTCIYHDDYGAAYELTEKLIDAGRKNLALIGVTDRDIAVGKNRRLGFLDAAKKHGITVKPNNLAIAQFSMDSGYALAKELLTADKTIDGLYCVTDNIAAGAVKYLTEEGKRIPVDISIVGTGDSNIGSVIASGLTTAHFYYKTSGEDAGNAILKLIKHAKTPISNIKLGYMIVNRGSV